MHSCLLPLDISVSYIDSQMSNNYQQSQTNAGSGNDFQCKILAQIVIIVIYVFITYPVHSSSHSLVIDFQLLKLYIKGILSD